MGVPKFFRFISERYPLINTAFPAEPPRIDNLYLDMNGIIHNCVRSSPGSNDAPTSKRYADIPLAARTPHDIYLDVFKYVDNLVSLLTPRCVLYLAVDGVAPRAKMNQQRARRFRSAKERIEEHAKKLREDPIYKAAQVTPFDSNCITPGTAFMYGLSHALRYFVARKISEDPAWQRLEVILSGPEAPGEGEHKIMEYIRAMRESGRVIPNTRHCVYGLDADLIMLALVTHEPHFFLLREKVDFAAFWRKKSGPRTATALDVVSFGNFELMSIGVLREYIALELGIDGNNRLPFFNVERLYDDFVFILMLIGNDFLPNLPTLDISDGTLSVMLHLYKRLLPIMGGYLTDAGTISPLRFEFFVTKLALLEEEVLKHRKEMINSPSGGNGGSGGGGRRRNARALTFNADDLDLIFSLYPTNSSSSVPSESSNTQQPQQQPLTQREMRQEILTTRAILEQNAQLTDLKQEYYVSKFGKDFMDGARPDKGQLEDLVAHYINGITWTLKYYTEGCRRWHWFFPFHYAPLASDIASLDVILPRFENEIFRDEPFLPWQQLLSVLPPLSAWCLPKSYQKLMTSTSSPIRDFYPEDFGTDLNGKRNDWEAVVLLPFVDEDRLKEAIVSSNADDSLTAMERACNKPGPSLIFRFSDSSSSGVKVASPFPTRLSSFLSRAKSSPLQLPRIAEGESFSSVVLDGTTAAVIHADLPSLAHYNFESAQLLRIGVNVFGSPSKGETLVLRLRHPFSSDNANHQRRRRRRRRRQLQSNQQDTNLTDDAAHNTDDYDDNDVDDDDSNLDDDHDDTGDDKSDSGLSSSRPVTSDNIDATEAAAILSNRGIFIGFPAWFGFPWRRACSVHTFMTATTTYSNDGGIIVSRPTVSDSFTTAAGAVVGTLLQKSGVDVAKPSIIIGVREERKLNVVPPANTSSSSNRTDEENNDGLIYQHEFMVRERVQNQPVWDDFSINRRNNGKYTMAVTPLSKGQIVLYVGHGAYFGHLCTVLSNPIGNESVKVKFDRAVGAAREPPFGYRVVSSSVTSQRYMSQSRIASDIGLPPSIVDAFLGSVRVKLCREREEVDLGLGVKYVARRLYVPGYARHEGQYYTFSERCAKLLRRYARTFPAIFAGIERRSSMYRSGMSGGKGNGMVYSGEDILPRLPPARVDIALRAAQAWLALQDVAKVPLISARADVLAPETVRELERQTDVMKELRQDFEKSLSGVDKAKHAKDVNRLSLLTGQEGLEFDNNGQTGHVGSSSAGSMGMGTGNLFPSNFHQNIQYVTSTSARPLPFDPVPPKGTGLRLGDRVVNRLAGSGVPFGLRGTVVGLHLSTSNADIVINQTTDGAELEKAEKSGATCTFVEVVFDEGFIGGGSLDGRCSGGRGKAVPAHSLFIIRPERDNAYYSKNYGRVAARVASASSSSSDATSDATNTEAIATAAVQRYTQAISPAKDDTDEKEKRAKARKKVADKNNSVTVTRPTVTTSASSSAATASTAAPNATAVAAPSYAAATVAGMDATNPTEIDPREDETTSIGHNKQRRAEDIQTTESFSSAVSEPTPEPASEPFPEGDMDGDNDDDDDDDDDDIVNDQGVDVGAEKGKIMAQMSDGRAVQIGQASIVTREDVETSKNSLRSLTQFSVSSMNKDLNVTMSNPTRTATSAEDDIVVENNGGGMGVARRGSSRPGGSAIVHHPQQIQPSTTGGGPTVLQANYDEPPSTTQPSGLLKRRGGGGGTVGRYGSRGGRGSGGLSSTSGSSVMGDSGVGGGRGSKKNRPSYMPNTHPYVARQNQKYGGPLGQQRKQKPKDKEEEEKQAEASLLAQALLRQLQMDQTKLPTTAASSSSAPGEGTGSIAGSNYKFATSHGVGTSGSGGNFVDGGGGIGGRGRGNRGRERRGGRRRGGTGSSSSSVPGHNITSNNRIVNTNTVDNKVNTTTEDEDEYVTKWRELQDAASGRKS